MFMTCISIFLEALSLTLQWQVVNVIVHMTNDVISVTKWFLLVESRW